MSTYELLRELSELEPPSRFAEIDVQLERRYGHQSDDERIIERYSRKAETETWD